MNKTFADTYYYLALLNPGDAAHARALAITDKRSGKLVTTYWVLTEVGDAMSLPADRHRFIGLLDALELDPDTIVVPATSRLFRDGATLIRERPDKAWSLTDCISIVVMERQNIRDVLTADHHTPRQVSICFFRNSEVSASLQGPSQ